MTDNRRLEPRKNAFLCGSLQLDGATSELDCLVWDESRGGAMIELADADRIPDRFSLAIGPDGHPRACMVVRRDGRRLGVVFDDDLSRMPA